MIQIAKAEGKAPIYRLDIQDIIRDFNGKPHQMIKMVISGENFPIRNVPIFVRIRSGKIVENSWLVELSANSNQIIAYFPIDVTQRGNVEFGYGDEILGIFNTPKWAEFKMLDNKMIDSDVVKVDKKWIDNEIMIKKD
jgi:uncharacterized protein YegJ (DUF2314 family)